MAVFGMSMMTFSLSATFALLLVLASLMIQTWSYETVIVLLPYLPQQVYIKPYEFYEILVPLDSLEPNDSYYIKTSFVGAESIDIFLKRKKIALDEATLYENSNFNQRYKRSFSKGLRDHVDQNGAPYSIFTLNEAKAYTDDENGEVYEIIKSGIDSKQYLVFTLLATRSSMTYDEEYLYKDAQITLELLPPSGAIHPRVNSMVLAYVLAVFFILVFLAVSYFFILPKHIKD